MPEPIDIKKINFKLNGIGGQTDKLNEITRRTFLSRALEDNEMKKLGIKHVKGILLYGPPGCGKTLIAKTIGKMLNCATTTIISGTELLNKWVGESEENVRNLFRFAIKEPDKLHLIIIDEFDSISKKRDNISGGTYGISDRIVNEFLSSMDGPKSVDNFILIGMTNYMESIDKALLRPGRLEVHIKIDLPEKADIIDILKIHTKKIKNSKCIDKINLNKMADLLIGYTGAEIEGVVKSAVSRAMERHICSNKKNSIFVLEKDFIESIKYDVKPQFSGLDENLLNLNKIEFIDWSDEVKKIHLSLINKLKFVDNSQFLKIYIKGKKYSGKFTLAYDCCKKIKANCIRLINPYLLLKLTSDSDKIKFICDKFDEAKTSKKGIVIVQDFDRIIELVGNQYNSKIFNAFIILLKKSYDTDKKLITIFTGEMNLQQMTEIFDKTYELPYLLDDSSTLKKILKKFKIPNEESKNINNVKDLFMFKQYYDEPDDDDISQNSEDSDE